MSKGLLTIGQFAKQCGISRDTLRYYEKMGLLPAARRTPSGYRIYSAEMLRRMAVIQNGIRFGFSLKQLREFLQSRDRGIAPCTAVRAAGEHMLRSIEQQIEELGRQRDSMRMTLNQWDERLARVPQGAQAALLGNIGSVERVQSSRVIRRKAPRK